MVVRLYKARRGVAARWALRDSILVSGDLMRIQLLTFAGCAHADAARELLARVLASSDAVHVVEDIDTGASGTPEHYREYGSPTILVDGEPIGGGEPIEGSCCRLYRDEQGRLVGVPPESALRAALVQRARPRRAAGT